jgi:hypothetical protein
VCVFAPFSAGWSRLLGWSAHVERQIVTPRTYRIVALSLPLLVLVVLVATGGWRIHDARVERVSHSTPAAQPAPASVQPGVTATSVVPQADRSAFVRHLSPSVPWPAWAGLIALCILPAMASMLVRNNGRRRRDAAYSPIGGRF